MQRRDFLRLAGAVSVAGLSRATPSRPNIIIILADDVDLMPTCVQLAGASYPAEFQGRKILPTEGRSLLPAFAGQQIHREAIFWEHEGSRAVRMGKWKAVALLADGHWQLYDMMHDRTEMHNLAARYPERLNELVHAWNLWAQRTHAIPWPWKPQYSAGS